LKVQSEKLPGSMARLQIEVDTEEVQRELDRAYRRLANRVVIPGFRKGKAPRPLVERALGEGAVMQEATQELAPKAIARALEQESLDPVAEPDDFKLLETDPFRFEVTVPLVPTVTLGDYKSVKVARQPVTVSDEEVDEVIEGLRERQAEWVDPEPPRPAAEGDQLIVDLEDFVDGEPVGEKQEDVPIVLGEGTVIRDLEAQLPGVEAGNEYEYDLTLPEDFPNPDLAGKPARFKVTVKSVKAKRLPELTDEWAAGVGGEVSDVAQLRDRVRENLQSRKERDERDAFINEVIDRIVATSEVEVPQVLVDREVGHQLEHLSTNLGEQGLTLDQYFQYTGQKRKDAEAELQGPARQRLVRGMVLGEVAKAENLDVEESEIQREIDRISEGIAEEDLAEVRETLNSEEWRRKIRSDAYDRKVLNLVAELASGRPLDPPRDGARDAEAGESSEQPVPAEASAGAADDPYREV
jgi:trigger factor